MRIAKGVLPVRAFTRRSARRRRSAVLPGWRWRRNPLRRRTDVVEAWLLLVTSALLCLTPLAGWWAGHAADRALQRVVRAEHSQRTLVTATAVPASAGVGTSAGAGADAGHGTVLRWTAPDRTVHTATAPDGSRLLAGDSVRLWTDHQGTVVGPPLDASSATAHAVLAGVAAATASAGLLLISRQILLWRLMVRRLASWERAWARAGRDWGRAGTGG